MGWELWQLHERRRVSSVGLCSTGCTAAGANVGTGSADGADPLQTSLQPTALLQGPVPEPVHQGLSSVLQAGGRVPKLTRTMTRAMLPHRRHPSWHGNHSCVQAVRQHLPSRLPPP